MARKKASKITSKNMPNKKVFLPVSSEPCNETNLSAKASVIKNSSFQKFYVWPTKSQILRSYNYEQLIPGTISFTKKIRKMY